MSVVQLFDAEGNSHELARLRADVENYKRMLAAAHEEIDTERETVRKWKKENSSLKAQITRHERLSQNVNHPLVVAVFDFWKALKGGERLQRGPARAQAILAGLSWDPPSEPKHYIWPVLGIVASPAPKKDGKGYHDELSIALRDDEQVRKWTKIGQATAWEKPARVVIEEIGGDPALEALDRILELQAQWEKKSRRGVNEDPTEGKEA